MYGNNWFYYLQRLAALSRSKGIQMLYRLLRNYIISATKPLAMGKNYEEILPSSQKVTKKWVGGKCLLATDKQVAHLLSFLKTISFIYEHLLPTRISTWLLSSPTPSGRKRQKIKKCKSHVSFIYIKNNTSYTFLMKNVVKKRRHHDLKLYKRTLKNLDLHS